MFTKIVNNSRTWLRLVPSIRVITKHINLKIQNLQMKHIKSLNKTLYYSYLTRSTYTSTHVRPRSSPLPRNTCKHQQYVLIFKQNICIYHKNRTRVLYTIQYNATTKALFRSLHLNLRFTKKDLVSTLLLLFISFLKNRRIIYKDNHKTAKLKISRF